jgi:hypothetical protein
MTALWFIVALLILILFALVGIITAIGRVQEHLVGVNETAGRPSTVGEMIESVDESLVEIKHSLRRAK